MGVLPWRVVVEKEIHYVVESYHTWEVIHLSKGSEVVVLEGIGGGIGVVLHMVHMDHKVVGMVDMGWGHMEVFGEKGLVSRVEVHVEDKNHKHMVVVLDYHKRSHHSH